MFSRTLFACTLAWFQGKAAEVVEELFPENTGIMATVIGRGAELAMFVEILAVAKGPLQREQVKLILKSKLL